MHSSIYNKFREYDLAQSSHKEFSPYTAKNHIVLFCQFIEKKSHWTKGNYIYIYVAVQDIKTVSVIKDLIPFPSDI